MNDFVTREEMERYTETAAIIADNAEKAKRRCAVFPLYLVRGLIRVCKDREEPKRVKVHYDTMTDCKERYYICPRCFSRLNVIEKPDYCGRCGQRVAWFEGAGIGNDKR